MFTISGRIKTARKWSKKILISKYQLGCLTKQSQYCQPPLLFSWKCMDTRVNLRMYLVCPRTELQNWNMNPDIQSICVKSFSRFKCWDWYILYCFFWISPPSSQSTKSFILLFSRNICRVGEVRWGRIVTEVSNQCAGHFTSNTSTKPLMSGSIPPAPTLALIFLPTVRHWQYSWMHIQFLYVQRNNMYHEKLQWGYSLKETRYLILALPLAKDIFSILFHSVASKKIN